MFRVKGLGDYLRGIHGVRTVAHLASAVAELQAGSDVVVWVQVNMINPKP